jgi:hypothetical protein
MGRNISFVISRRVAGRPVLTRAVGLAHGITSTSDPPEGLASCASSAGGTLSALYPSRKRGNKAMPLARTYTVPEVKDIIAKSEAAHGHAIARHIKIGTVGLITRSLPKQWGKSAVGVSADALSQASAFAKDDVDTVAAIVAAMLNSDDGQEGLRCLDVYAGIDFNGKTVKRFALTQRAADIGFGHVRTRVFYQDKGGVVEEGLQSVTLVVDATPGGATDFVIVTVFPSKGDKLLELGEHQVVASTIRATDIMEQPAKEYFNKCKPNLLKPQHLVEPGLIVEGQGLLVGTTAPAVGWMRPNKQIMGAAPTFISLKYFLEVALSGKFAVKRQGEKIFLRKLAEGESRPAGKVPSYVKVAAPATV